jgi:hypothetical protein
MCPIGQPLKRNMSANLLPEVSRSGDTLKNILHRVIGETAGGAASTYEKGAFVVTTARQITPEPFERPSGKEDHPLLVPLPDSLCLPSLKVDVMPVQ